MMEQEIQESSINLEISLEEVQNNFPVFSAATKDISRMKYFILNNSISNMIRRKVGWPVSNDTYDHVINAPEYSTVKNEVDSITDPVLLMKFNIFCVRNIMHFLQPTLVEHMGEKEAAKKLNNVWQMALP